MFLNKLINKGYQAQECQLCQTQFNLMKFQRIHKCKRCQKFICRQCGKNKQRIIDQQGNWTKDVHRICKLCKKDFVQIHDTIQKNNMQWNRDTPISKQWLQNIKNNFTKSIDYQYGHFLKLFNQNLQNHQQQIEIIDKDVIKGRTDSSVFNFSMREFFYTVKSDIENEISRDNIKNVLYALAARFDKIGYCQGMSGVAAFLLCFSSQKTAYILFCDLLQNVYPHDMFIRSEYGISLSGLLAETYFLQQYFMLYLNSKKPILKKIRGQFYDQDQLNHFRTIIQLVTSKALLSLFVGVLSFSNCIFIWQQIKQNRSFQVVEKAFIALIYLNRQKILENRSFKIIEDIFERMNLEEFKQFYYDIEINLQFRNKAIKQYHQSISKKWQSKPEQQVKTLEKITNFNQKELKELKELFKQKDGICITLQDFQMLVKIYYEVLKKECPKDTILETKKYFLKRIFENFDSNKKGGLDFREFILCFSICTKSKVNDRIFAIINTFKDEKGLIQFDKFSKLIENISMISDEKIFEQKKGEFIKRMNKYFNKSQKIHFKELQILLNDDFINELSLIIRSQTNGIIFKSIEQYKKTIAIQNELKKSQKQL